MRHPSGREQQREAERVTIVIESVWRSCSLKGERDALENMKGERPTPPVRVHPCFKRLARRGRLVVVVVLMTPASFPRQGQGG